MAAPEGPDLVIQNVTAEKHKDDSENTKHSGFHITVSTNRKPASNEESHALGARLNKAIALSFEHTGLEQFIEFLIPDDTYKRNILKVSVKYAIELGKGVRGGRIHAHIMLKVIHNSRIRINIPAFKKVMLQNLNLEGDLPTITSIYVNIKIIRGDENLEEYLLKKEVHVDVGDEVPTSKGPVDTGDAALDKEVTSDLQKMKL